MQSVIDLGKLRLLDGPKAENGKPAFGGRILARKYRKVEKIGSIWVNPAWQTDNSRSLWEPIAYSANAIDYLCDGIGIERDPNEPKALPYREALETRQAILVTAPHSGALMPVDLEGEDEVFLLWAKDVVRIHPWMEEEDD